MSFIYRTPKNHLKKITEMYAFVSSTEDGEGIIASQMIDELGRLCTMPFVGADRERIEFLKPLAKQAAKDTGIKVKLIRLTNREDIEEYT